MSLWTGNYAWSPAKTPMDKTSLSLGLILKAEGCCHNWRRQQGTSWGRKDIHPSLLMEEEMPWMEVRGDSSLVFHVKYQSSTGSRYLNPGLPFPGRCSWHEAAGTLLLSVPMDPELSDTSVRGVNFFCQQLMSTSASQPLLHCVFKLAFYFPSAA